MIRKTALFALAVLCIISICACSYEKKTDSTDDTQSAEQPVQDAHPERGTITDGVFTDSTGKFSFCPLSLTDTVIVDDSKAFYTISASDAPATASFITVAYSQQATDEDGFSEKAMTKLYKDTYDGFEKFDAFENTLTANMDSIHITATVTEKNSQITIDEYIIILNNKGYIDIVYSIYEVDGISKDAVDASINSLEILNAY